MQTRSHALRGCSAYILRPHIFAGASVENYLMGAFRGTPNGKSSRAEKMRKEGKRLPCMFPRGQQYLDNKIQFIHVDDMARLIRHILQREPETQRLTILNVAGKGEPLTFGRCVEMAHAKLVRVPGKWAMRQVLKFLWKQKISAIPPEAVPYMTGEYIMNTDRLRRFLGPEYDHVIRYTIADAFADSVSRHLVRAKWLRSSYPAGPKSLQNLPGTHFKYFPVERGNKSSPPAVYAMEVPDRPLASRDI